MWQALMDEIGGFKGEEGPKRRTSLPDPLCWRDDVGKLAELTGLRRKDFGEDEAAYVAAVAKTVSPPMLPATLPPSPDHSVELPLVDDVILQLLPGAHQAEMRSVVLTGMGGAGKSVIASAVVRDKRIRRHFADGVLWLDGEPGEYSEKRFLLQLDKLAQQFEEVVLSRCYRQGTDSQYNLGPFASVSGAQRLFQMWQKKFDLRCLLVVDNTWNLVRRFYLYSCHTLWCADTAYDEGYATPGDAYQCFIPQKLSPGYYPVWGVVSSVFPGAREPRKARGLVACVCGQAGHIAHDIKRVWWRVELTEPVCM